MVLSLLIPLRRVLRLEDIITLRHVELMCKVTLATGSIVGYAYGMEFFSAWYSGNPYERYAFINRATGHYPWAYWTMISCNRSEQRRVGKKWKSRWWPVHYNKKNVGRDCIV